MKLQIVFAGTSLIACKSLQTLIDNDFDISLVITKKNSRRGRGRHLTETAVAEYANEKNITCVKVSSNDEIIQSIDKHVKKEFPTVGVVVDFGLIFDDKVLDSLPKNKGHGKWINIHFSLLPELRGPSPIETALLRRKKKTGITFFFINEKCDAGDILHSRELDIAEDETIESLRDKLIDISRVELPLLLNKIETFIPAPQYGEVSITKKLTADDYRINWNEAQQSCLHLIRILNPKPGAWTTCNDEMVKIFSAIPNESVDFDNNLKPGALVFFKDYFIVKTFDGYVKVLELQVQGKKRMPASEWMRGLQDRDALKMFT